MIDHKITLTHLNIRQSIAIMLTRLIVVDIILSFMIVAFYYLLVQGEQLTRAASQSTVLFLTVFAALSVIKIALSIYIVLQWLNEYYEITPESVIHKQGIVAKKTERYNLDKVRALSAQTSFLGEMYNFATLTLYDMRMNKYLDMYLIHDPQRYVKVLRQLLPHLEIKTDRIALPGLPNRERFEEFES